MFECQERLRIINDVLEGFYSCSINCETSEVPRVTYLTFKTNRQNGLPMQQNGLLNLQWRHYVHHYR